MASDRTDLQSARRIPDDRWHAATYAGAARPAVERSPGDRLPDVRGALAFETRQLDVGPPADAVALQRVRTGGLCTGELCHGLIGCPTRPPKPSSTPR